MHVGDVVDVDEVLHRELPVGGDLEGEARPVHEAAEVVAGPAPVEGPDHLVEVRGGRVQVDEHHLVPDRASHRLEPGPLRRVVLVHSEAAVVGAAHQGARKVVAPGVVGAHDAPLAAAHLVHQAHPAVPAVVVEHAQLPVLAPHHEEGAARRGGNGQNVAGLRHVSGQPEREPAAREEALPLEPEEPVAPVGVGGKPGRPPGGEIHPGEQVTFRRRDLAVQWSIPSAGIYRPHAGPSAGLTMMRTSQYVSSGGALIISR